MVDVEAPAPVVFRWLCQLRVAPYSYDWIDNFGRRSPRTLTPGLEDLELGQRFVTIFDLVDFEPDRHVTLAIRRLTRFFGTGAITYRVEPRGPDRSRLGLKIVGPPGRGLRGAALPWGDLVMARRQLLNLKALAEGSVAGDAELPYVDEHSIAVDATPQRVWKALGEGLSRPAGHLAPVAARLLGAAPDRQTGDPLHAGSTVTGFRVARAEPARELALVGRHRFARYALVYRLEPRGTGTLLRAETRAAFPGIGRVYRALVIGTRLHVVAVRRTLSAAKRRAERA
jgi:hypothetical protein